MKARLTLPDLGKFLNMSHDALYMALNRRKSFKLPKHGKHFFFEHEKMREFFDFTFESKIVAFQIVKGGVGKSTLSTAFAERAWSLGFRVLFIDLDQQGNSTDHFGVDGYAHPTMLDFLSGDRKDISNFIVNIESGFDLIPSNLDNAQLDNFFMLKRESPKRGIVPHLQALKNQYDLIVIDCPPSLGPINGNAAIASDLVICPILPDISSIKGLTLSFQELERLSDEFSTEINTKVLMNRYDRRTNLSHHTLADLLKDERFAPNVLGTFISTSQDFAAVEIEDKGLFEDLKSTQAKKDIDDLVYEVLGFQDLKYSIKVEVDGPRTTNSQPLSL